MRTAAQGQRLFFALWPDAATRAALARPQAGLGGGPTPPEKLHLTLAFLGQRPDTDLPALTRILARLPARAMTLEIDTLGYFAGRRIAWAGMRAAPPALLELRAALMDELAAQQFSARFEEDRFRPHLTLARKAEPPAGAGLAAPIVWRADHVVLAVSQGAGP
ncbi:MAG TPA: RNA 2',3'-cyclic phosphodiesterase [Janthinobacterium sp.]|nr:RNA 2',3'-cyclic phosphodiesterase [Janthinobacterium sp.]